MNLIVRAMIASASLLSALGCAAETINVSPDNLDKLLSRANGGDTILLAAGEYQMLRINDKKWNPPLIIDARGASMAQVVLNSVSGLIWNGGTFEGKDTLRFGWSASNSNHITVNGLTLRHFTRVGIAVTMVSDARITNNLITDSGSDGIDIALSRRILVDKNECRDTKPTDGAHPDCIQMWSRPTAPPIADITITNNKVTGMTQGFTGFNHVRDGIDDGGFDRIIFEHNSGAVALWHGIFVGDCRNCKIRFNHIDTIPNGRIKAWIKATGSDIEMCGNVATAWSREQDQPCKK